MLHDRKGGPTRNLKRTYDASTTPDLAAFRGRSAQGRWTLRVRDMAMRDEGRLVRYGLDLTLSAPAARIEAEAGPQHPARRPRRAHAA